MLTDGLFGTCIYFDDNTVHFFKHIIPIPIHCFHTRFVIILLQALLEADKDKSLKRKSNLNRAHNDELALNGE